MRVRLTRLFLASVVALGLAACSSNSSSTTPFVSIPSRGALTYIALGDSLTAGWGSSLCGPPATLAAVCVTSPTQAGVASNLTDYSALVAQSFNPTHSKVNYIPLGVGGANTGGAPLRENPQSGDVLTNPAQIPALAGLVNSARSGGGKVFVSLLIGPNDVTDAVTTAQCLGDGGSPVGFGGATPIAQCMASGTSLSDASGNVQNGSFYRGYLAVLNAIAATNPDAVLVIGLPDASKTPRFTGAPASTIGAVNAFVQQANAAVRLALSASALGSKATYFDSYAAGVANPLLYSSQFFSADGYHPNDIGYGNLASSIIPQIQTAYPTL